MASLNRVFLIGVVATPPADRRDACEFVLGVPEERAGEARLERVRIVATGPIADAVRELRTAQAVYADGRLVRSPDGAAVEASAVIALGDAPPEAAPAEEPAGTHERVGHPRRLQAGTERERVVWVRPTRLGDPAGPRRAWPRR
jgi:hypothetical protein